MIVKVQLSLASTDKVRRALVRDQHGFWWEGTPNEDLVKMMRGEPKAFFHAEVKAGAIEIGERAPWQEW